jgi:hypothetical protein
MSEAIGEPVQHPSSVDKAFIKSVETMAKAQRTGAAAVRHFSHCDNQTKLKLLGYSHSRFFLKDLKPMGLPELYETYKEPYLSPQQVGFAYKDGFNEVLIEELPENQKTCFKEILAEPEYGKRKEKMEVAILNFLESPDAVPAARGGISTHVVEGPPAIIPAAASSDTSSSENDRTSSGALPDFSTENATVNESENSDATVDYQFEAEVAALKLEGREKSH